MKPLPAAVLLALAFVFVPDDARACSCVFTWEESGAALDAATVVFLGEVQRVEKVEPEGCADERVTFWVLDAWKGAVESPSTLRVVTSTTGRLADGSKATDPDQTICIGGCGASVEDRDLYLVFASLKTEKNGEEHLVFDCTDVLRADSPEYPDIVSKIETVITERERQDRKPIQPPNNGIEQATASRCQ